VNDDFAQRHHPNSVQDKSRLETSRSAEVRPDESRPKKSPRRNRADAQSSKRSKPAGVEDKGLLTRSREFAGEHPYALSAAALIVVALCIAGIGWWLVARNYESTDDAFIDSRVVAISSQVAGAIVDLAVTDNQAVDAGAVLLRIDDRSFRAALDQAKAKVEQAEATIANLSAQIDAQQALIAEAKRQVTEARAALTFSQQQNLRAQDLVKRGAGTVEAAQQAQSDLTQKQASFNAAIAAESAAEKQVAVLTTQQESGRAQLDEAKAQQNLAEINLSRTVIKAPVDGIATKITGAKGAYAQPGQALMMFVPKNLWITANFKETQLDLMRVGQPVDISIDAYPERTFKGHVASIQAGSGAAFSLLPPENATGNYVKVVQRVPVKIVFDKPPDVYVGPGMSVVPSIKVR
jgi:membrane fusion protein, multidrug efflux system